MTVLALGLAACGDDGKPNLTTATTATTPGSTNTTNPNNTTDGTATDATDTDDTDGTDAGTATESTATDPTVTSTTTPTTTEGPVTTTTTTSTTDDTATATATTVSTTDDTTTDTTTGGAGGEYGGCGAMGECPAGSDCLMITGLEGNFCAPQCDGMMCPPTGAMAQAQCVLGMGMGEPTHCAALCPPGNDAACPAGTTCKEVPDQPMPIGVCTAP
ncbi:hypothetical protein [Nannocystis exedens]|uniref:hypothetical protein n=1 Tax=Nannocystis exedens TaxID=54 RepID=UPI000BBA0449|nr:hypothetical protein [Nannocystis exedens]